MIVNEFSGNPCPNDPDSFWIDDKTGERVSLYSGEREPWSPTQAALYNMLDVYWGKGDGETPPKFIQRAAKLCSYPLNDLPEGQ